MTSRLVAGALALALMTGAADAGNAQTKGDEEAARSALKAWAATNPEYAQAQYDLVKAHAGLAVRIERLTTIGVLCRLLTEEDTRLIIANARQEMEFGRSVLSDEQEADFAVFYDGLRYGALTAAAPDAPTPAECEAFARPGGTLIKLLTWTGRPQFISPGVLASPRTIP